MTRSPAAHCAKEVRHSLTCSNPPLELGDPLYEAGCSIHHARCQHLALDCTEQWPRRVAGSMSKSRAVNTAVSCSTTTGGASPNLMISAGVVLSAACACSCTTLQAAELGLLCGIHIRS